MASGTTKDKKKDVLLNEVYASESILAGMFWSNPDLYSLYSNEKLSSKSIGNPIWKFYFALGRHMYDKGVTVFDDIATFNAIAELNANTKFEEYGEFETISEVSEEVKDMADNFDAYYGDVKKYSLLRELRVLFGDKVAKSDGKYDYKKMNTQQINLYWQDKLNKVSMGVETEIKEYDLLDGLGEFIEKIDENPDIGIELYRNHLFNEITNGWARGTITLFSAFSGNGKTSFAVYSLLMACIQAKEKLLIIANEMSVEDFRKTLLITIMGTELFKKYKELGKKAFQRKNINKGNFTDEEKERLHDAVDWVEDTVDLIENKGLIKFVPMEDYNMDNVEKTLKYYSARGYKYVLIDTAKPSLSSGGEQARWVRFVEDFERLYQIVRKDNGLNLGLWCTVQSADEALKQRFLDERCLADGRKIKNVCDVVYHIRPVWQDELAGGANEIKPFKWKWDEFDEKVKEVQLKPLDTTRMYYALFVSKNRRGQTNLTGLPVLIFYVDFNTNRWIEVGYARVSREFSY